MRCKACNTVFTVEEEHYKDDLCDSCLEAIGVNLDERELKDVLAALDTKDSHEKETK